MGNGPMATMLMTMYGNKRFMQDGIGERKNLENVHFAQEKAENLYANLTA